MKSPPKLDLSHESETQRQHVRVKMPGTLELSDGKQTARLQLCDISAGGFSVDAGRVRLQEGARYDGRLCLTVSEVSLAIPIRFRVVELAGGNRVSCAYCELGAEQISTLRHLISSYLSGEMVAVGEVLTIAKRDNFTSPRKSSKPAKKGFFGRVSATAVSSALLIVGVVTAGWAATQLYDLLFVQKAIVAKVSGPLHQVQMPREGVFTSLIPDDRVVEKGAPLGTFETPMLELVRSEALSANLSAERINELLSSSVTGTVTSPCHCRVQKVFVGDGQLVGKGHPLFELVPLDFEPQVIAQFRYDQLEELAPGKTVNFRVNGEGTSRRGKISDVRVLGNGEHLSQSVLVSVAPETPLNGDLASRPVVLETGGFSPWSAVNPIQNAVADER